MMVEVVVEGVKAFRFNDGKKIQLDGIIDGRFYRCQRDARQDLHFEHFGWGIDTKLLEALLNQGVIYVHVFDSYFQENFYTLISDLQMFGVKDLFNDMRLTILEKKYWAREHNFEGESSGFVHLHTHSDHSLLDGMSRVEEIVLSANRMGMNSVALTDHGTLQGAIKFHKLCEKVSVKPIIGCEFYFTEDVETKIRRSNHVVLLAKNHIGYQNLCRLSTKSHMNGFYYVPRIDRDMIIEHHEGLIALSACLSGVPSMMVRGKKEFMRIKEELFWWKEHFGGDYFVEIMPDDNDLYRSVNPELIKACDAVGVKMIATVDSHYMYQSDAKCHNVLKGIGLQKKLSDDPGFGGDTYFFMNKDQIYEAYEKHHPYIPFDRVEEFVSNTQMVADKIERYDLVTELPLPTVVGANTLKEIIVEKLRTEPFKDDPDYLSRIEHELKVIHDLGFEKYFVLIGDIVWWAKNQGIQVGAGRGSVAGSLVAFVMGITDVDPLKYGLIFERFLNPSRKTMPDIDIDFDHTKRDLVFEYIRSKWNTARISTYVSMRSKGILKDCCRVFDIPFETAEAITKPIPSSQVAKITIDKMIITDPAVFKFSKEYSEMFGIARRLEGNLKSKGLHPAGIIVADIEISDVVALRRTDGSKGEPTVQCDMDDADALGLLKIDCLSAKAQTIFSALKEMTGVNDFKTIPLDDKSVYRQFTLGNCYDIFQFQSQLGRDTAMKIKPRHFEDLTAIAAVVRPGAYDFIDDFKNGDYIPVMDEMIPILSDTRNIILYQEQAMKIAVDIAGFSFSEADDLRKAIGKKKLDAMTRLREKFIEGGVARGHSQTKLSQVFSIIQKSSNYLFVKSHATAYTLTSYWQMWFKIYFPKEWFTAELTVHMGDDEKVNRYVHDARQNGMEILPPCVNKSDFVFKVEGHNIRCGLGIIKAFSEKGWIEIEAKRGNKPFVSFEDFIQRVSGRALNKTVVERLIKSGAFDCFNKPRKFLYSMVDNIARIRKMNREKARELFSTDSLTPTDEWTEKEIFEFERESFGFYLVGHPIQQYKDFLRVHQIDPATGIFDKRDGTIKVAGVIISLKKYSSKRGEIGFIDLSSVDNWSIILWNPTWVTYSEQLENGQAIIVCGRKTGQDNKIALDTSKGDRIEFAKVV